MTEQSTQHTQQSGFDFKRVVLWATLFLCVCLLMAAGWLASYAYRTGPEVATETVIVDIPRGASVQRIGHILGAAGLIHDDLRFSVLARVAGFAGKLRAGEFQLDTGKKPLEVMQMLATAVPVQHVVTIPEGLRATEIAHIFAQGGWCDVRSYESLVNDKVFIAKLGLAGMNSLEGYLYPDTYFLTRNIRGAEKMIRMQVQRFHEVWAELVPEDDAAVSREKTVILASMVEKETGAPAERPLIAAVFHNRLKKGMRLQSDPTVVYGVENFSGTLTRTDLRTPTPYNTYTLPSLPIGPICSPGRESLAAVLHPAETDFLYFVSKNDGTHQFSTNLAAHNRAVRKYQRKKNNKNGKQ